MRVERLGDAGLVVAPALSGSLVERAARLAAVASALRERRPDADVVQGGTSLLVIGATEDDVRLAARLADDVPAPAASHHEIEVVYDGPDLGAVADAAALSEREVARLHHEPTYTALVTGFLPGFAYLGEIDPKIVRPRLATPRKRVAPGAVGIAGTLTGVYPFASPGGWTWIARAIEPRLFDATRSPARRIAVLDTVRFVATARADETASVADVMAEVAADPAAALLIGRVAPVATVQDAGRPGLRGEGIPTGGAADPEVLAAANAAVGNPPSAAAIEIPLASFNATALRELWFSIDGGPATRVTHGETITVPAAASAVRYLAVAGGIDVPVMLGACSTLPVAALGGHHGRALRRGDRLRVGASRADVYPASPPFATKPGGALSVAPAPADARLGADALERLLAATFSVSTSRDRLGTRLDGARLPRTGDDRALPEPVVPGAVQVTTDGSVIVLGPDAATTGGYPVVAVLSRPAQGALARLRPGAEVRFHLSK